MSKARKIALSSIFAVFTSLGAQLSFYIGPVPITLQSLFVILSGIVGGYSVGLLSQLIYLALGLAGLPVFAGFKSGFATLLGPTAGYLISFPIAAAIAGLIYKPTNSRQMISALLACISAELIIYGLGVPWLIFWFSNFSGLALSEAIYRGVVMGSLVFLPGDGLKIAIIIYLLKRKDFSQIIIKARA
ncbi:MAG: biotin transporter BioY [Aigarchaeota archaeon]|nr:biotin transporter BioY [Aigarchaeota archaeon]MCX8192893.1 biotin transporter BioY [Nitrososphaeria archaeon]MDW7986462.1 biotin transporter BioY [Nitrososphaerota archaeon]